MPTEYVHPCPTVSDLPSLIDSVKDLIERNIIATQPAKPILAGQDEITVDNACGYHDGDTIIVYDSHPSETTGETAFTRQVMVKPNNVLWLSESATKTINIPAVQRLIADTFIRDVYPFDPPAKRQFPCITVDGDIVETYPLALGGTSSTVYSLAITTYAHADNYETANRQAWAIAREIERALFNVVSPDPNRPQIWRSDLGPITHDQHVNDTSTLKTVTITWTLEEVIQRFAEEMRPLIEMQSLT